MQQRPVADPDRALEPERREQERRVLLRVADRVARERHAGRERDQREREDRDRPGPRPAALHPDPEGGKDERHEDHQVALLEARAAVGRVERRLGEEREHDPDRERGVGRVLPHPRAREREREAGERARHQREAGRVREQQRVGSEPVAERERMDAEVGDARVVAEQPPRPESEHEQERGRVQDQREAEAAGEPAHGSTLDDERGDEEGDGQEDVLDAREGRKHGEGREPELRPAARAGERADAQVHGREDERVGDGIREHERREEEVGRDDGQRGPRKRGPLPAVEPPHEQVDGDRGQRHGERVLGLGQPVGEIGVVEEPERRGEERLEQRGEVRRVVADQRAAALGERARDSRVDVLVREVERGRVDQGRCEAEHEADDHDPGEHEARWDRRSTPERLRAR